MDNNTTSSKASSPPKHHHHGLVKRILKIALVFVGVTLASLLFYISVFPGDGSYYDALSPFSAANSQGHNVDPLSLDTILRNASMKDKTIIVTTLNDAWAEPNSIFDLFLESFRIGNNTKRLLKHLVVICLDQKAYARCLVLHPHCYQLYTQGANFTSEAAFMSSDYLHMMWRRIQFLTSILERGYSFVFTDTDIMWLRDPFQQFFPAMDADFQIACDYFRGDSYDVNNLPNGGFTYVISNQRTIQFYNFWYFSRQAYPNNHDQDVLNKIKSDPFITTIGLKMRFLDTKYFGGFCQPSRDFNLVCTMHANCCVGLHNKVNDLKILLQDWTNYMAMPNFNTTTMPSWTVPQNCSTSFQRQRQRRGRHLL